MNERELIRVILGCILGFVFGRTLSSLGYYFNDLVYWLILIPGIIICLIVLDTIIDSLYKSNKKGDS